MLSPDRLRRPFGALFAHEIRTVGLALVREGALVAAALAGVCILSTVTALRYREQLHAFPELLLMALPVALLAPWAVWKGDPPFGRALLWTLPVRRQEAAAAKILAGALWLMAGVLLAMVSLMATAIVTGGSVGVNEVRMVGPFRDGIAGATPMPWSTPFWMWFVPFGAVLIVYFASSAALIGLRHPLRWAAGAAVAATLVGVLAVNLGPYSALQHGVDGMLDRLVHGVAGLDFAITGGSASLSEDVRAPGRGSAELWRGLPSAGRWATALLVWLGAALLALALALRRHWER